MWVEVGNVNCRVTRASDSERGWLYEYLSFEDAGARFRHASDERFRMFSLITQAFPTGFLPMVQRAAAKDGVALELADRRQRPCEPDVAADLGWLRDYQVAAVDAAVERARGIWWMPTGSGKTDAAVGLALRLPCRWLLLVHRTGLAFQAADRFEERTGMEAGRIGEGRWEWRERFTAATFQTLYARFGDQAVKDLLRVSQGLIVDEAHTLPAASFLKVARAASGAYWRVGMSGTPLARGDQRSVVAIGATGPVIHRVHPQQLIDAGILAKPHIRFAVVRQDAHATTFQGVYGECVVRSSMRNRVVVRLCQRAAKPCLVFVKEIAHGRSLRGMLDKAGLQAEFVWGQDSVAERVAAATRLARGDCDVLVSSAVFNEGVDIPALASVVVASGGKSAIAALQRIGRGMRSDGGRKRDFEVWDVKDEGNRWLERHSRERMRAYAAEGHETVVLDDSAGVA